MSLFVKRRKPLRRKATLVSGKRLKTISKCYNTVNTACNSIPITSPMPIDEEEFCIQEESEEIEQTEQTDNKCSHRKRKEATLSGWSNVRDAILSVLVDSNVPISHNCALCDISVSDVIRCEDCGPSAFYCKDCCDRVHSILFLHCCEIWKNGLYFPYYSKSNNNIVRRLDHYCDSCYKKNITAFDCKGRQHEILCIMCLKEKETVTLARHKLWAATPLNPQTAFHFDLLEWSTVLMLECQVSLRGFCQAVQMKQKNGYQKYYRIKEMYRVLVNEAACEYRYVRFENSTLRKVCPELDDGQTCPACPISGEETSQPRIYSVDADFQLVRKYSSGYSYGEPRHQKRFFANQSVVDNYISSYGDDAAGATSQDCNNFQAGDKLRSKGKSKKLDETALFGSACRHGYPKIVFNLKHGERLAYSVFLLEKLHEECRNSKIYFLYDIACKLEAHLRKSDQKRALLESTILCIPIFHAYGHQYKCQVLYGPRRTEGIGLTDGETMERLWSYLGKFKKITKEMSSENRHDLLVDALLYYCTKLKNKMGNFFLLY